MWSQSQKSGTVAFRERFLMPITGKYKVFTVTLAKDTAANRKLATTMLRDLYQSACAKSMVNAADVTLSSLRNAYLEHQQTCCKASTLARNTSATSSIMTILGGPDVLVNQLSARYISQCFLAKKYAPGTINEFYTRLRAMLRWGYENDYLESIDWLGKLKNLKDKTHREKISDKFLEPEESTKLINHMQSTGMILHSFMTRFLLLSGLRIGEAIALNLSDIDYGSGVIHITKTYDARNDITTTPKTATSIRDIVLTKDLEPLIQEILSFQRSIMRIRSFRSRLFLPDPKGGHYHYAAYAKYLKEAAATCGIQKRVTPHTLRHTYASLLMAQGINIDIISRALGHDGSAVTKQIYLHITEVLKAKDAQALRNIKILA